MPISRLADASALPVYQQIRPPPVQALSPVSLLWFILSSVLYDAPHSWKQMQQTCLTYCFRPILHVFITIKKVCAHDNKGFTSRQKKVCAHDETTRSRALLAYDQDFQPMKLLFKMSKLVDR